MRSPHPCQRPEPLALDLVVHDVALELAADALGSLAARADQADAAARQRLDCRHANLLAHAADHHHAFVETEVDDAAHRRWLDGSSLLAWSSKCSASAFSEVLPLRVRA